jgi:TRAP-type C4-dicarboxylate transport system substrate-binding protein
MRDDPDAPIQEVEVQAGKGGGSEGGAQPEFFDQAKERLDRAVEEAKQELTELVEEAREEFVEIRDKAPGWVQEARRKVADFLEPEPDPKEE